MSVFTILPFEVQPEYSKIAKGGLADPQLWNRTIIMPQPSVEFGERLRAFARGRRVLAFIGTTFLHKGLKELKNLMAHPEWNNSVCVVVAGRVPDRSADIIADIQALGALVFPRFASGEEIDAIYELADFVWAAYLPGYDQASGIFGRAIQFGKLPIVREGALVERLAEILDHPVISINFEELQDCVEQLQQHRRKAPPPPSAAIGRWKDNFIEVLEGANEDPSLQCA